MSRLLDLVIDNPIIIKDGLLALRRRRTLLGLGFSAVAVAVVAALIWLDETAALAWASNRPVGDGLMLGMLGLAFLAAGVLLPAAASSTISGEREHGTLPLLMVTGLSPARIVVGKTVAMVVLATPFVCLPLPAALLGAVSAGVTLWVLAVALCGLAVSMAAFAAVGVYASSLTARSRTSAPAALLGAAVPGIFCALPAMFLITQATERFDAGPDELQAAVAGLLAGGVIALAALYGAWSNLANRAAGRLAPASGLFIFVAVGLPLLAAGLGQIPWDVLVPRETALRAHAWIPVIGAFFFVAAAVVLFSAGVGRDRRAPVPWKIIPPVVLVATVGSLGALLLVVNVGEMHTGEWKSWTGLWIGLWLRVVAAAGIASLAGRFVDQPLFGAGIGVAVTLVLILVPALADEFTVGTPPLAFLNFVYVGHDTSTVAVLFWLAISALALALSRRSVKPR